MEKKYQLIMNSSGNKLLEWAKNLTKHFDIPVIAFNESIKSNGYILFLAKPIPTKSEIEFVLNVSLENRIDVITCEGLLLSGQELKRWLSIMSKRHNIETLRKEQEDQIILNIPPRTICFEPTSRCNLACPHCSSGRKESGRENALLDLEIVKKILSEAEGGISSVLMPFLGEALLLSDLTFSIIKEAKKYYTIVDLATNGHFLTANNIENLLSSGVNSVTVTIEGLSQDTYSHYRVNGILDRVLDGLRKLIELKKQNSSPTPHIRLQMIMMRHNMSDQERFAEFAESLGVDSWGLKTMHVVDFATKEEWLPPEPQKVRQRFICNDKYEWQIKNNKNFFCDVAWTSFFVNSLGQAVSCCFDESGEYAVGNFKQQGLMELWNSSGMQKLRSDLLQGIAVNPMCLEFCQSDFS